MVTVAADRIQYVGTLPAEGPVEDLGNVAIVPGLVNAHAHLEFSHLSEPLGHDGIGMTDWIGRVIECRLKAAERPAESVRRGIDESRRWGTTTLAEIAQPDWSSSPFETGSPLDATVFLELIGPTEDRVEAALDLARRHLDSAGSTGSWRAGLSPHAPYSVHPKLLLAVVSLSIARRIPLSFHLAESREEMELLRSGSGPFRELLEQFGAWDAGSFTPGTRPLGYLRKLGSAHRALIVHGNYLDEEEISYLGSHADHMAVVYCPRTHAFFRHDDHPLQPLLEVGATVALGTDSRASSPDLNMLAEMRQVARAHPSVSPATILRLATLGGAKALGLARRTGSLEPGKWADLAVVSLPDQSASDPHELLFDDDAQVMARCWHGVLSKDDAP